MYVETNLPSGGTIVEWVSPPPTPTHKTSGLSKTEWRKILTPTEQIKNDKARAKIDGDMSWLMGGIAGIDDEIDIVTYPAFAVFDGATTYRDILRTTFGSYNDATELDVTNEALQAGTLAQSITGLLDYPARIDTILLGLPL